MRNKLILLLSFVVSVAIGQTDPETNFIALTEEQNQAWLTDLKKADKSTQLEQILERFFHHPADNTDCEKYKPLIVLDGLPISFADITKNKSDFLLSHLTSDHIQDFIVFDKKPEDLYINKRFTGMIVLTFKDKRTSKKWKKLN